MNFNRFEQQAEGFLVQLEKQMKANGISLPAHWSIDHLCYRVETNQAYSEKKEAFSKFGRLLIESEVNGRPISTFKLSKPICFLDRKIDLLELPAPKVGKSIKEGFEHIEVVCDLTFDEIKTRFKNNRFEEKGLTKDFNAELELLLDEMSIKFHQLSLESVVTLENNSEVFTAMKESEILSQCREFSPLIAGTFPLGINTENSDLDTLMYSQNLDEALNKLRLLYGSFSTYESYKSEDNGIKYGIVRFKVSEVPFEIYIEKTETVRQRAYRHFQIEERLLKLGGEQFRSKVLNQRQNGIKTEPAFGAVLGLRGDPYLELLELHGYDEKRLEKMLESVI